MMNKYRIIFLTVVTLLLSRTGFSFALGVDTMRVTPTSTNANAQFKIGVNIANGAAGELVAGVGTITITFDDSNYVPASIPASLVTLDGVAAADVTVSGQEVTITTPTNYKNIASSIKIIISSSAGIRNPSVAAFYRLQVRTSSEAANIFTPFFQITATTTQATSASVTPNPSVENLNASYTITFAVGAGGALTTSSTVTIVFPSGTTVPDGSISGVTFNGTTATAAGTAATRTVVITAPLPVDNSGSVTIFFSKGSGLYNPGNGSGKTLTVKTSSETTVVTSAAYVISAANQLSVSAISISNNSANSLPEYTIDFVVSTVGGLTANQDSIIVLFEPSTVVPANIANGNVTITSGGFSDNASAVRVSSTYRVAVLTPIAVANGASVSLIFAAAANIQNPAKAGNYTITIKTVMPGGSSIDAPVSSNPFGIVAATSTVTTSTVSLTSITPSATNVKYTFGFSTGAYGRLVAGTDSIRVVFPTGTGYTNLNRRSARVNGTQAADVIRSGDTVNVRVPASVSILNNGAVTLVIDSINNPTAGTYTTSIATSVEKSFQVSASYAITNAAPFSITRVGLGNNGVNQASADTIYCSGIANLDNGQTVTVIFPEGTTLPSSQTGQVSLTGGTGQTVNSVSVNQSSRTVTIVVGNNNKTFANIVFASAGNIINPSVPSTTYYKVTVSTTTQPSPVTSPAYTIKANATSVTAGTVTATPNVKNYQSAQYQINFTPGTYGQLVGGTSAGSDSIYVKFTTGGTVVPSSITPAHVKVNGIACSAVSVITSGSGGTIGVVVPSGMTLPASTEATVTFDTAAGLKNGATAGNYQVQVATSAEYVLSTQTNNLTIADQASLTITQVTPSPSTVNAAAAYTIKFTTGSSGALSVGNTIVITFPANTYVPATIDKSLITVNSTNPTVNASASGQALTITTPVAVGNIGNVTVAIGSASGILNPILVSTTNTLTVSTTAEGAATSPYYSTTATTTTITTPSVTPSVYTPSTANVTYKIDFNTGANGRLLGGTSTITITFPTGTNFGTLTDSVNGIFGGTPSRSGQAVTVTVPASVTIGNNSAVIVKILGITNPTAGNYTLTVKTSVETGNVNSASYPINNAPSVTGININIAAFTDTVNMAGSDTIKFTTAATGGALTINVGTITVTFPSGTNVPASITAGANVKVNGTNTSTVTTNPGSRQVTVTTPVAIGNNTQVTVAFATGCNIINPSIDGPFVIQVATSAQPVPASSPNDTIKPTLTTVTNLTLSINPADTSKIGRYTFSFKTGLRGALVSGTSQIFLIFPQNVKFTTGVPSITNVTVNSVSAAALALHNANSSNEDTLVITVPASVTIGNQSNVTVVVDSTAGVKNASSLSQLSYKVYTSVERNATTTVDFSLPVELAYFKAYQYGKKVMVEWKTESEIDNAYWIIDKAEVPEELSTATPSQLKYLLSYQRLNVLDGQGTKTSATDYFIEDEQVVPGKTYAYRLVDVSLTGEVTYHQVMLVKLVIPNDFKLHQNYPNPFNPSTKIQFDLPYDAKVSIIVYNILEQEVRELTNKDFPAGFHELIWEAEIKQCFSCFGYLYLSNVCGIKSG